MNKQIKSILSGAIRKVRLAYPGAVEPHPYVDTGKRRMGLLILGCLLLAACTEADGLMDRSEATVNFSLGAATDSPEVVPTRADPVNMAVGTTVRVLAYRRPDGSGSAVLSNANYAGEAVYKVKLGGALELCGVTLDANGFPAVDAGATPQPLQLIAGIYDFYAVTPALSVDHSGSNPTLDIRHRMDYAVSVTSQSVSPGNSTVSLVTLERQCTLLSFNTDRAADATNITSASIGDVTLSDMADEPMTAVALKALDIAANTNGATLTLPSGTFTTPDASVAYQTCGSVVCLPKSSAAFVLKMNVSFNNGSSVLLEAPGLTMGFDPCKQYAFTIRFKDHGGIELLIGVVDWTDAIGSTEIGIAEKIPVQVVVGEWSDAIWDTSIGGTNIPPFTPNVAAWDDLDKTLNVGVAEN